MSEKKTNEKAWAALRKQTRITKSGFKVEDSSTGRPVPDHLVSGKTPSGQGNES